MMIYTTIGLAIGFSIHIIWVEFMRCRQAAFNNLVMRNLKDVITIADVDGKRLNKLEEQGDES